MAFMDTASSWVSKFLGVENTADSPALLDPDAPTAPDIDDILNGYKEDLTRQNLITLGRDFSPDEIKNMRHRARYGDPRFMYAFFDEMLRLGPGTQKQISIEAMKAAMPQFVTSPEDWDDDSNVPLDADPVDVANARAARDYLQDTLTPHLADLIQIHGNVHFYGIADSKIVLNPRGNSGQWDAIADISEVPARRHRLDVVTHEWMLMPSPDSWEGVPISQLLLQPDQGTEGLFFTEIGAGSEHLDQRGLMFRCIVPWGIEQYTVRWRAKYIELFGIPPRYALVDFAHPNRVAEATKGLKRMGANSYGVFQLGTEVKLLEAHTAGNNDPFEAQLDWCQRQYDSAILGHSQMTGVQKGVGGKMQGSQATQQFEDVTNSRLRTLSAAMSNTLGKTLVARNFSPKIADLHAPSIKLRFADRDDPEILSKVALTLFQAGAGELIGSEDLVRRCTMRLAIGDEKNLGKPAAGASGGAGSTSMPMSAAENRQMLTAIANADSHEYKAIRTVIAQYVESEKKRALAYGKKRLAAVKK